MVLKKNNLIIFFIFCFSFLKAENFIFEDDGIDLEILFHESQVSQINFAYEIDPNNLINGNMVIKEQSIHFDLKSKRLEYDIFKKFAPKSGKKTKKTIYVNWDIGELKLSDKYSLKNVSIEAAYKSKFIELSIIDESKNFEYIIKKNNTGSSPISMYSNNAGEILRARNITSEIEGGILFINGIYNNGNDYEAVLKIKDFEIKKDSKYETLISSTRIFDFVSIINNSKSKFTYMEVPFKKQKKIILIDEAFVVGGMVGFTFNGLTNLETKSTDIDGFYGPLYLFDRYVDKIPLFNKLLTNKKNESLLGANFSINTADEETSITINPLSIVTPGKTKRIFKIFDFLRINKKTNQ